MTEQEREEWRRLKLERVDLMRSIDEPQQRSYGAPPYYARDMRRRIRELDAEIEYLEGCDDE